MLDLYIYFKIFFDALGRYGVFGAIAIVFVFSIFIWGIWGTVYFHVLYVLPICGFIYWLAYVGNMPRQDILWLEFFLAFYIAFSCAYTYYLKYIEHKSDDDDDMVYAMDESWLSMPAASLALCSGAFCVALFSLFVKFYPPYMESGRFLFFLCCLGFMLFGYIFGFGVHLVKGYNK